MPPRHARPPSVRPPSARPPSARPLHPGSPRPATAIPRLWLMTDERMGAALWPALAALPRGAGVVFRHHATADPARRALFARVRAVARRRGLPLLLAGPPERAAAWGADGWHGPGRRERGHGQGQGRGRGSARGIHAMAAHDRAELVAAARAGADVAFLSPVFATRTHPGAATLGRIRFGLLARGAAMPVVALGGMTRARAPGLAALGAHGWAAIDGLSPGA